MPIKTVTKFILLIFILFISSKINAQTSDSIVTTHLDSLKQVEKDSSSLKKPKEDSIPKVLLDSLGVPILTPPDPELVKKSLAVFMDELVELILLLGVPLHSPEKEGTDWVVPHDRVKKPFNLIVRPFEFTLDGW